MKRITYRLPLLALGAVLACDGDSSATNCPDDELTAIEFETETGAYSIAAIANQEPPPLPDGAIETSVEIDGHRIFAFELPGEGPPFVLMHGLPDNTYLYDRLYSQLAGRRVIAFDFVGWGRSDRPMPGDYPYDFAQQTRELEAVLDAFEVDQAVIVAHDSSGPPAIDFTRANLDRVERLVLLNTFYGRAEGALRPPKGVEVHSDPRLEAAEVSIQSDPAAIEAYFRFQMDEFIVADPDEAAFIDGLWSLWAEARPAFVTLTNRLLMEVGGRTPTENAVLAELDLPVSIIFGVQDPYLNPAVAEHFAANIPGAELHMLDGAGHFVQVDAPVAVAELMLAD